MHENEIIIARIDDLDEGQMKAVRRDGGPDILLIRKDDRYYATEAYCTHYGAPLETGFLCDGKLTCPWHHARFEVISGKLKDPPALNGLKTYNIEIRGRDIILRGEKNEPQPEKQGKRQTFIIVGGGSAGNAAAKELRKLGFEGIIKIITADDDAPYDRPNLSKDFLKGDMDPAWLPLNSDDYYKENDIELLLSRKVTDIDKEKHAVRFENGTTISYDKLLVASGSKPRKPRIPGIDQKNIFTLRSRSDAENILSTAGVAREIVIIGASFIGMETAENLNNDQRNIHVIAPEKTPFIHTLGEDVGNLLMKKMKNNGIKFHLGNSVSKFNGNGTLESVVLEKGDTLEADMVILGIGVEPVSDFMPHFKKAKDGSLLVDESLQVEKDIFAAGDVATFPFWKTNSLIRVEHWRVAEQQGMIAARNMLNRKEPVKIIPFFWINLAGMEMRYVGHAAGWDDTIIQGNLIEENFIVYYVDSGKVKAALGAGRDVEMAMIEELMARDAMPDADKLTQKDINIFEVKKNLGC